MKKSKTLFAIVAVVIVITCVIGLLASRHVSGSQELDPGHSLDSPDPDEILGDGENDEHQPSYVTTPATSEELGEPEITQLADNVTMKRVDLIAKVERGYVIDEAHEEYIDVQGGDPYFCTDGIVFRNDRVLTIDVLDQMTGVTHSISFGYMTGKCNRFLYLNPLCTNDGEVDRGYCYQFDYPIGGGDVINLSDNSAGYDAYPSLVIGRSLEEWENASYTAPNAPGVVWHIGSLPKEPVYIDCRVYEKTGDMVANIRITIERALDGTVAITNLQDRNLLADNTEYEYYTASELAYLVDLADQTIRDSEKVGMAYSDSKGKFSIEDCIISVTDQDTGLYYRQFVPYRGVDTTSTYVGRAHILAVSLRTNGLFTQTLYFRCVLQPVNGEHGWYDYIGRDYQVYDTVENMMKIGYSGNG